MEKKTDNQLETEVSVRYVGIITNIMVLDCLYHYIHNFTWW